MAGSDRPSRAVARAPASVGNLSCGFDVLGLALEEPSDQVAAVRAQGRGVQAIRVDRSTARIPTDPARNSAGVAADALLRRHGSDAGVELEVTKGLPLSSGMGGSAASAVAAVVAVDALLDLESSPETLLQAALEGERVGSGSTAADNVAAALVGGIVLVRPWARRMLTALPVPDGMTVVLLRPHLELETREGRGLIPQRIPREDAVEQWGDTAALAAALHTEDWDLLADAVVDRVAEPVRAGRIPAFEAQREAALGAGAAAFGISGSGPSTFALCRGEALAGQVASAMERALRRQSDVEGSLYLSPVRRRGATVTVEP
jgi:homoserine kinase